MDMLKIKTYRQLNYAFNKKNYKYATLFEMVLDKLQELKGNNNER